MGAVGVAAAHFMMGFGLLCVVQLHMSWVVLVPFLLARPRQPGARGRRPLLRALAWTAGGPRCRRSSARPDALGPRPARGRHRPAAALEWVGPWQLVRIAARFLSFTSFRDRPLPRPQHGAAAVLSSASTSGSRPSPRSWRWPAWRSRWPWCGSGSRRTRGDPQWRAVKWTALGHGPVPLFSYFLASNKDPQAHAFYVVAPLALVYAFHCFRQVDSPRFRKVAAAVLVIGVVYHAGLAAAS